MENAKNIQKLLNQYGFKTLAAGGFVRDTLLGRKPKDIDLATYATPQEMAKIFEENDIKYIETGLKHGTLTVMLGAVPYEVTTLRLDKTCCGREAEVEFIKSFREDAARRDFTINSMFMDLVTGEIFDYYGGKADIKNKTLRFVGDPAKRIQEDYLRILRLYRFACQLGFSLKPSDIDVARRFLPYLAFVSPERILDELKKMVIGEFVEDIFSSNSDMVATILPELIPSMSQHQNNSFHYLSVYKHTLKGLDYLRVHQDPILSITHLLHDIAKPYTLTLGPDVYKDEPVTHFYNHEYESAHVASRVAYRLRMGTKEIKRIKFIINNHLRLSGGIKPKTLRKLIAYCDESGDRNYIFDLHSQRIADIKGMQESVQEELDPLRQKVLQAVKDYGTLAVKSPLNGYEILLAFESVQEEIEFNDCLQGWEIGKAKDYLIKQIVEGYLKTDDRQAATQIIRKYFNQRYE